MKAIDTTPITIHFKNVGAAKQTWDATVSSLSAHSLTRAIRRRKALASRTLEFSMEIDGDKTTGVIWAGFRKVGKFEVDGALMLALPEIL